jgi:hypothetical protein
MQTDLSFGFAFALLYFVPMTGLPIPALLIGKTSKLEHKNELEHKHCPQRESPYRLSTTRLGPVCFPEFVATKPGDLPDADTLHADHSRPAPTDVYRMFTDVQSMRK